VRQTLTSSTFGSRAAAPRGPLERTRLARLWPAASSGEAAGHRGDRSFGPLQSETPIMRSTCGFAVGGEDEPATLRKLGKRVSAIRFAYLGCRMPECGAVPCRT
jgi:hypothetical protein